MCVIRLDEDSSVERVDGLSLRLWILNSQREGFG